MTGHRAAAQEILAGFESALRETAKRIEAGDANHQDANALRTIASLLGADNPPPLNPGWGPASLGPRP